MEYVDAYEAAYGKGTVSTFGAHAWDAGLLMAAAVRAGAEEGAAGHAASSARRCATRSRRVHEVHGAHGIFNMSPTDHLGLDQRARVMVKIENGAWKYQP